MKAKEKQKKDGAKKRAGKPGGLFPQMKESDMTDIDRKINALLTAEGYAIEEATRSERGGWYNDLNINHITYLRGDRERVFTITHEVIETAEAQA